MKKCLFLIMGMLCAFAGLRAQAPEGLGLHPVSWHYRTEPLGQGVYQLHITAMISPGWHLYSQHQPEDAIILPTAIQFTGDSSRIRFEGGVEERGRMEEYENEALGISAFQYRDKVDFVQVVKQKSNSPVTISGTVTYQACRREECLKPETTLFEFTLK